MHPELRILALCGSLRRHSFHRALIKAGQKIAPAGMKIEVHPDLGDIPLYNFDLQHEGFPERVLALAEALHRADGVLLVSPEYNWSVSGVLKNAIDWISRVPDHAFKGKPVAMQTASGGALGGSRSQYHLRQIMASVDAVVLNKPEIFVNHMTQKIDIEKAEIIDTPTREIIEKQFSALAGLIRAQKAHQ